jgi:Iron-sulfur cluster-binding domain
MATLEITTMIGCPLMCNYCPQDNLRDAYGDDVKYMSLDTFKTAIDKIPVSTKIDFSGMAEAWVNPDCTAMLEYALARGHRVAIYTTLYNWDQTTVEQVCALLTQYARQIVTVNIHMPDKPGNMRGWKYSTEWEMAFRTLTELIPHLGINLEAMTMSDHGEIHDSLAHMNLRLYSWVGMDRAGSLNLEQIKEQPINFVRDLPGSITCAATDFYDNNVLLPNGDVVLCCMDYDTKHIIGNLLTQSYAELFTGPELTRIKELNLNPCATDKTLCRTCTGAKVI